MGKRWENHGENHGENMQHMGNTWEKRRETDGTKGCETEDETTSWKNLQKKLGKEEGYSKHLVKCKELED